MGSQSQGDNGGLRTADELAALRRAARRSHVRLLIAATADRLRGRERSPLRRALGHVWFSFAAAFAALVVSAVVPAVYALVVPDPAAVDTSAARADERVHDAVQALTQQLGCVPVQPGRSPARPPVAVLVYADGVLTSYPADQVMADRVLLGGAVAWCSGGAR